MKPLLKWVATCSAVLFLLSAISLPAWGQAESFTGTYVKMGRLSDADVPARNTVVLKLKPAGQNYAVYGSVTRYSESDAASNVVLALTGNFYPASGQLSLVLALPPGLRPQNPVLSTVDGVYDSATKSFSLTFKSSSGGSIFVETEITRYTDAQPFVVGVWQWAAADTPAGLTSTPPQYSGEFYILWQNDNGDIRGVFSDGSVIRGQVEPEIDGRPQSNVVGFDRTWTVTQNNQTQRFDQAWVGQAAGTIPGHIDSIQGGIQSLEGSDWKGEFVARWDLVR